MINLNRFTKVTEVLTAIVDGWGIANGRKVFFNVENGWYIVTLGNQARILRKATALELFKNRKNQPTLRVYALGDEGIPVNFDNLFSRGFGETIKIHFMDAQPFEIVKVITDETKRWYFYDIDARLQRGLLTSLKAVFAAETGLDIMKGITPELRYYYLLLNLQRQSFREYEAMLQLKISEAEKAKRIAEFQASFAGRLKTSIEQADGELLKFYKVNSNSYMVEWKVKGSRQIVKSTIHDDMRILNLGFCASGYDKDHSLASAVQLAKMYGELYITRE